MINRDRLVETFMSLVKINSPVFKERKVAEYLLHLLAELGVEAMLDESGSQYGSDAGNIIGHFRGRRPDALRVLLSAHMDTLVSGVDIEPIIENGIIKPATKTILAADDKAGLAIILEVLRTIKEKDLEVGDVEIVISSGEEEGLLGAKHLDLSLLKADVAFVLDSDGPPGGVTTRAPSYDSIKAWIKGQAAHAGACPEKGINAIAAAARAISQMKLGRIDEETTANVGVIKGGVARNVVPEECYVEGEARSHDPRKLADLTASMIDALQRACAEAGATFHPEVIREFEAFHVLEDQLPVRIFQEACRRCGLKPRTLSSGGGSDTNIFNAHGIPAVNLPIGIRDAHTDKETLSIKDFELAARLVLEIVRVAGESRRESGG
ncbi:MAG: Peptidase T [Actinobacteria bacterium]|nr:Peptidase T [Actinomycetota bacterium]